METTPMELPESGREKQAGDQAAEQASEAPEASQFPMPPQTVIVGPGVVPDDRIARHTNDYGREALAALREHEHWLRDTDVLTFNLSVPQPPISAGELTGDLETLYFRAIAGPRGMLERALAGVHWLCDNLPKAGASESADSGDGNEWPPEDRESDSDLPACRGVNVTFSDSDLNRQHADLDATIRAGDLESLRRELTATVARYSGRYTAALARAAGPEEPGQGG